MICERCGKEISDTAAICPSCGTVTWSARKSDSPTTSYGGFPPGEYEGPPEFQSAPVYDQGYKPQQFYGSTQQPIYAPSPQQSFNQPFHPGPVNVTIVNNYVSPPAKNNGALLVEIILSLIGIYGVGWSMAGRKTVGTTLIICSVFYWFLALGFLFLTLGFGILCLGPVSIVLIIVNAILLNNTLTRGALGKDRIS